MTFHKTARRMRKMLRDHGDAPWTDEQIRAMLTAAQDELNQRIPLTAAEQESIVIRVASAIQATATQQIPIVVDHTIPPDELHVVQGGRVVARIQNIGSGPIKK